MLMGQDLPIHVLQTRGTSLFGHEEVGAELHGKMALGLLAAESSAAYCCALTGMLIV